MTDWGTITLTGKPILSSHNFGVFNLDRPRHDSEHLEPVRPLANESGMVVRVIRRWQEGEDEQQRTIPRFDGSDPWAEERKARIFYDPKARACFDAIRIWQTMSGHDKMLFRAVIAGRTPRGKKAVAA